LICAILSVSLSTIRCTSLLPKSDGKPLESLCVLDFEKQMCWVDEKNSNGFPFSEMAERQRACRILTDTQCWFGIDTKDLSRIQKTLNK
jgi:hypothetical protein